MKQVSGSTLPSCATTCSNMRIVTTDSCNAYFLEAGICQAGIIDNPMTFAKPFGSSPTLVALKIVDNSKTENLGERVKPGQYEMLLVIYKYFFWFYCFFINKFNFVIFFEGRLHFYPPLPVWVQNRLKFWCFDFDFDSAFRRLL